MIYRDNARPPDSRPEIDCGHEPNVDMDLLMILLMVGFWVVTATVIVAGVAWQSCSETFARASSEGIRSRTAWIRCRFRSSDQVTA